VRGEDCGGLREGADRQRRLGGDSVCWVGALGGLQDGRAARAEGGTFITTCNCRAGTSRARSRPSVQSSRCRALRVCRLSPRALISQTRTEIGALRCTCVGARVRVGRRARLTEGGRGQGDPNAKMPGKGSTRVAEHKSLAMYDAFGSGGGEGWGGGGGTRGDDYDFM